MSTFMTRMLALACMAASLALFTGCSSKPVDQYQPKAGAGKAKKKGGSTFYDYGDPAAAADAGVDGNAVLDSLPDADNAAPAVEPLTAGSGRNDGPSFDDKQSDDYKRRNGRSSPQMKSVFYDFDQAAIRNDQVSKMEANAKYLKENHSAKVVVEGNCDEQGTSEYNIGLGERRAAAAKRYLMDLGVQAARVRTVSYGEDRPLFLGSEQSDYELNRRCDFVLE
jgi:peptidoglycan-associated lipoprotein